MVNTRQPFGISLPGLVRKDEDTVEVYVSYRLHEKDWWYEEILPHRVQKLNGELNFGDKKC